MAKQTASRPQGKPDTKSGDGKGRLAMARAAAAGGKGGGGATARGRQAPNLVGFFNEARSELRKVTWPTRQETMNLTGAVIAMTVGMAAFLGLIDGLLDLIIKPLIGAQ